MIELLHRSKNIEEDPMLSLPLVKKFIPNNTIYKMEKNLFYRYGFAIETELEWDREKPEYDVNKLYRPVRLMKELPGIPTKAVTSEEYVFWKTWFDRMLHGWIAPDGRYLTGVEVFKLNFVESKLRDQDNPTIFTWLQPEFRDNDHDIHSILWNNRMRVLPNGGIKNARNHIEAKARGVGWTISNMAECQYDFVIHLNGDGIARAYPDEESVEKERTEFQEMWSRLHPIFRSLCRRGEKTVTELEVLYSNKAGDFAIGFDSKAKIKETVRSCSFDVITTEKKAGIYKGDRKLSIEVVEAGKWKNGVLISFFEKNERCILSGDTQWGYYKIGGTSDKISSNDTDYKKMIESADKFNATLHLSNAGVCQLGFINRKTGESNYYETIKSALKKRKEKEGDPERLQAEISENPIFLSELLSPKVSYAYNKTLIIEQEKHIIENRLDYDWARGRIEYEIDLSSGNKTGRLEFVEDNEGRWLMNIHAQPLPFDHDNIDIAAIDDRNTSYQDGVRRQEKDSKNAMIIWRRSIEGGQVRSNIPAMVYFSDEPDLLLEYQEFIKGIKLYDVKQVINEKNNLAFYNEMRSINLGHRVMEFNGSPGLKVTLPIKNEMTRLGLSYWQLGYYKNLTSRIILDSFKIWGSGDNTDIGSAIHLIFYLDDWMEKANMRPRFEINPYISSGNSKPNNIIKLGINQHDQNSKPRRVVLGVRG